MESQKGRITNIQRYSVHDGPGIRNTVFMKGCPLHCTWCANPETQIPAPELAYSAMKCVGCGRCVSACPQKALSLGVDLKIEIQRAACDSCLACVNACFAKAMHVFGADMTVDEVFQQVRSNRAWRAGGGVTVSGGEPLMQSEFVSTLLQRCRAAGIHTAIETTGYAPWEAVARVVAYCDLVFYDIKVMNPDRHKKYTGVDNQLILNNLCKISTEFPEVRIIVRTPVIPGVNDDPQSLDEIVTYLKTLPHLDDYEMLPYHGFGAPKYTQIGRHYELDGLPTGDRQTISEQNARIRSILMLPKE